MDHKNISRLLMLAGTLAILGILFVFYLATPLRMLYSSSGHIQPMPWRYMAFKAICGLPYLPALACYFAICSRIGTGNSFCAKNVRDMNRITALMAASALVWLAALILQATGFMPFLSIESGFPAYILICADTLAMLAGLAVSLVAKMMAYLLHRAVDLQEDCDLTI